MFGFGKKKKYWVAPGVEVLPKVSYSVPRNPISTGIEHKAQRIIPFKYALCNERVNAPGLMCVVGVVGRNQVYLNLRTLPHLLISGSTGSGKSVLINSILTGFFFLHSPADLQLVIIDCKRVDYGDYNGLPFMHQNVITNSAQAITELEFVCNEMDWRYKCMKFKGMNNSNGLFSDFVVVIDELADLMLTSRKKVEPLLVRIAQLGRAAGIHLIIATQSPKATVLTGLIKANIPCKIGLTTANTTESICIIGHKGLEKLGGVGHALIQYGTQEIEIETPLILREEVQAVCNHWKDKKRCIRIE